MPPMMPMMSPRSGRNRAMASVTTTQIAVMSIRTHSPDGLVRAPGPGAPQQHLRHKSCITDLQAQNGLRWAGVVVSHTHPIHWEWPCEQQLGRALNPSPTSAVALSRTDAEHPGDGCLLQGSPPQKDHNGVHGDHRDSEEEAGDQDRWITGRVGHQDISGDPSPKGQEAEYPWETERSWSPSEHSASHIDRRLWKVLADFSLEPSLQAALSCRNPFSILSTL